MAKKHADELLEVAQHLHAYALVIESAVRNQEGKESGNYRAIMALIGKATRLAGFQKI
jgi:hypothetical protein